MRGGGPAAASTRAGSRSAAVGGLAVLLLVGAGCSAAEPPVVQVPDGPASASGGVPSTEVTATAGVPPTAGQDGTGRPAPTATPSARASEGEVFVVPQAPVVAPDLPAYELEVSSVSADGPGEEAVVAAWREFWQALVTASGVPAYDAAAMGAVATDDALVDAQTYVAGLVDAQQRVTGRLVVAAEDVVVDGDRAVVDGCSDARDGAVDASGVPVEVPAGVDGLRTELVREGETWRVSLWGTDESLC